jgi:MFS family permease
MRSRTPWKTPVRYGYGEAVQSAGTIAAPLLAGFTITLIGLLVPSQESIRYPDVALAILMGAVACLLAAVQCAYAARQFLVTPEEIEAWWPGMDRLEQPYGEDWVKRRYAEQRAHSELHSRWGRRFRYTYHAGIMLVLLGLVVVLLPPAHPPGGIMFSRWLAVALAALAFLAEVVWISTTAITASLGRKPATEYDLPRGGLLRTCVFRVKARFLHAVSTVAFWIVPSYQEELLAAEDLVDELARLSQDQ